MTLVGKAWDRAVRRILDATLDENLAMIRDSVAYLCREGRTVIYDAEGFFDGLQANPEYALATVQAAVCRGRQHRRVVRFQRRRLAGADRRRRAGCGRSLERAPGHPCP